MRICILLLAMLVLAGCDRLDFPSRTKFEDQAHAAQQAGDYPAAVRLYEAALDGTDKTADLHLQLALIFDDKLKDPVSALHHFRRYLRMTTNSSRKKEVQEYISRIELVLATRAADGGIMTKREAVRLKNENAELQQTVNQLRGELVAERRKPKVVEKAADKTPSEKIRDARGFSTNPKTAEAEQLIGKETKTYVVQKGDTLAAIARKFYKTPQRWKDIADANHNLLNGGVDLKVGQVLIIPQ